jgi:D-alanyl-D-alanine carboxypeptidase
MIDDGQTIEGRGQTWSVFFGVAAIFIGVLVLASRLISVFDAGGAAVQPTAEAVAPRGDLAPAAAGEPQDVPRAEVRPEAPVLPALPPDEFTLAPQPATDAPALCDGDCRIMMASAGEQAPAPPLAPPPEAQPEPAPPPVAPAPAAVPPPPVSATSFAVIERSCGAQVAGKEENLALAPASVTKIITAMVAAERADLNKIVEIRDISAKGLIKSTDSSVMGIEPGMRFSVNDLLFGLLLPSGNDAALALAQEVSRGVPGFVALMNEKAAALGMRHTHFVNPHGLDAAGHFSTALDMAIAGRAFLDNPLLAAMAIAPQYETPGDVRILMKNGNRLLRTYPGAFGVKIGYTTNASQTIVAAAARDARELVLSVFGSEDRYADSAALFDWAFAHTASACR